MSQRRKLVVGNWKLNGSLDWNAALLSSLCEGAGTDVSADIAVCVPFPYLHQAGLILRESPIRWGSQSVSDQDRGAFTGEVSAAMVAQFGARFAIVGHSERRSLYGETDTLVAAKVQRVLAADMTPIVCVGESLAQRNADETHEVVAAQLNAVLAVLDDAQCAALVVAYEPLWAIGTGQTASAAQAQTVHAQLRAVLDGRSKAIGSAVSLLYGGSMRTENARELLAQTDIDGGLIGGASLVANDFLGIVAAARGTV